MNRMGLELPGGFRFVLQTFAGDFWADQDNPVMKYLRSKQEWATFEKPFEMVYDCPIYPDNHYKAADLANLAPVEDFLQSIPTDEKAESRTLVGAGSRQSSIGSRGKNFSDNYSPLLATKTFAKSLISWLGFLK